MGNIRNNLRKSELKIVHRHTAAEMTWDQYIAHLRLLCGDRDPCDCKQVTPKELGKALNLTAAKIFEIEDAENALRQSAARSRSPV